MYIYYIYMCKYKKKGEDVGSGVLALNSEGKKFLESLYGNSQEKSVARYQGMWR